MTDEQQFMADLNTLPEKRAKLNDRTTSDVEKAAIRAWIHALYIRREELYPTSPASLVREPDGRLVIVAMTPAVVRLAEAARRIRNARRTGE
jgi:hypothetical protein